MLGTIDQRHLVRLLDALQSGQAPAVLEIADELATRGLSYRAALADLAVLLSRVAIAQRVSAAVDDADPVAPDIRRFATNLHPDVVQLFYTVAVHSRSELAIAPDEYAGFVMACLRMLSLGGPSGAAMPAPDATSPAIMATPSASPPVTVAQAAPPIVVPAVVVHAAPVAISDVSVAASQTELRQEPEPESKSESEPPEPEPDDGFGFQGADEQDEYSLSAEDFERMQAVQNEDDVGLNPVSVAPVSQSNTDIIVLPEPWAAFAAKLPLSGMAEQLARQSECVAIAKQQLTLRVPSKALSEGAPVERLRTVLKDYFGFKVELLFEIGAGEGSSAHALDLVAQQARQEAAEVAIERDPFVQALIQDFGAKVVPGSIRPSQLN
jgi:DNA polymerase-3 subunit gamma/tau